MRPVTIEDGRVVEHRPASAHPEDICQRCGGPNVVWFAPNDVWNRVMPDDGGILCPTCFVQLATSAGLDSIWCVAPSGHPVRSLEQRLATVEAERDRLRALLQEVEGCYDANSHRIPRSLREIRADIRAALRPPTPGDTP